MKTFAMMTGAEQVSTILGDDGRRLATDSGATLPQIVHELGGAWRVHPAGKMVRYTMPDGSEIIEAGGAWDLALEPGNPDCWCWAGERVHVSDCPAVRQ